MRNAKYCVFWPSIRENHSIFRYQQVRIRFNLLVRVSDSPDRNVSFLTAPNNSTEAGQYCRREGLLLADVKAFAGRQRKKVLTDPDEVSRMQKMLTKEKGRVKELEANYRLSQREIERKDKVTAELSALFVLTKMNMKGRVV